MEIKLFEEQYRDQVAQLLQAMEGYKAHLHSEHHGSVHANFGKEKLDQLLLTSESHQRSINLAVEKDIVHGYIIGRIEEKSERIGRVEELYIDALSRGKGLGTRLVTTLKESFVQAGCQEMRVTVNPHNDPALHLYQKLAFIQQGEDFVLSLTG